MLVQVWRTESNKRVRRASIPCRLASEAYAFIQHPLLTGSRTPSKIVQKVI